MIFRNPLIVTAIIAATWLSPGLVKAAGSIVINPTTQQVIVVGTVDADAIVIGDFDSTQVIVSMTTNGVIQSRLFDKSQFNKIIINGGGGDDDIVNNTSYSMDAVGGDGNDSIVGGEGVNYLIGGAGNDELVGGGLDDTLLGEGGLDTLVGNGGNDNLQGGADNDSLNGGAGDDLLQGGDGDDDIAGEEGNDNLFGGNGNDFLAGGGGSDNLLGELGSDELNGGEDNDNLNGGPGDDKLLGGDGNDVLNGAEGNDRLRGYAGNDTLFGGADDDILAGDGGNDILRGNDGNDMLDGGFGWDVLFGGTGNDVLVGGRDRDRLNGDDGDDFLIGNRGIDSLYGNAGNDILRGDSADDVLDGGGGSNEITNAPLPDTTFGVVSNPANDPNHTDEDKQVALEKASASADQISLFWSFSQQDDLPGRLQLIPVIHDLGKKSLVQVQTQFVGDPAPPAGMNRTYADPAVRALLLQNLTEIAQLNPTMINLTPEINFVYYFSPDEFVHYVTLYQEAYALIKSISPQTQVGVSLQYLFFRGFEQYEIVDQLTPRDYLGFTTYPIWMMDAGFISSPLEIDPSYYTWVRDNYPNEIISFTEVGWPNFGTSTPEMQADYIRRLPELMAGVNADSINWTLLNNFNFFHVGLLTPKVLQFLADHDVDPVLLFERLNNVGLHEPDGTPLPGWFEVLQLNFNSAGSP